MAGFENTLGDAWLTAIAIENFQTRKVLFEKCNFFVICGDEYIKYKVKEGSIEEFKGDEVSKKACIRLGFYIVIDGIHKGEAIFKSSVVKELR